MPSSGHTLRSKAPATHKSKRVTAPPERNKSGTPTSSSRRASSPLASRTLSNCSSAPCTKRPRTWTPVTVVLGLRVVRRRAAPPQAGPQGAGDEGADGGILRIRKSLCARPLATDTASCTFGSPSARGRWQRIQNPVLSEVLVREAVGNGFSILRPRKSSCARPLATDTASCAFTSLLARGCWQQIQHSSLSEVLVRGAVGNGFRILRSRKSSCARPLAMHAAPCAFASPVREAVGNGYSTLRFWKSSCARPLATDTASCAFGNPRARGRWQRIKHPSLSQVLVREAVFLCFHKSFRARRVAASLKH